MTNKCRSSAGRFDDHGGAPEQYRQHCPMRHVHGSSGSHWTPASGAYLLRIAPAATRATINKTTIKQYTHFAGRFGGHCDTAVQYRAHCPKEVVRGFTRSHWMPPLGKHLLQQTSTGQHNGGCLWCISLSNRQKSHKTTRMAPNNNRGMTYQNDKKHLISIREYIVGGVSIAFNRLNNCFLLRVINQ